MIGKSEIGGVILAGGKASRMGFCDKALVPLHTKPIIEYVISKASPQVKQLILSVNHNAERYLSYKLPIVSDQDQSYSGPLLGILSAMRWYQNEQAKSGISHLACFPADVPEFPKDVVSQLACELNKSSALITYIYHKNQIQPLFSLWHLDLAEQIEEAIAAGSYGPKLLFGDLKAVAVRCADSCLGAFCNINSPEDLDYASLLIARE
ncbi:MAG: molybdopterin-guanine dinucleotide biosynthesis protein A [Pseudohongiellaceae bacterium]|jgi:molybdopterin-guanine dinucleotide biosynthesis protein A